MGQSEKASKAVGHAVHGTEVRLENASRLQLPSK